jgi:hypothetical protein
MNKSGSVERAMAEKITKGNKLNEVITKYPQTREVFIKHGMPRYAGRLPSETLEFFCRMHRVNIEQLLDELNTAAGLAQNN